MRRLSSVCLLLALSLTTPGVQADDEPEPLVILLWGEGDAALTLHWSIEGGAPDVLRLVRENKDGWHVIPLSASQTTYVEVEANITATYWIYAEVEGYVSVSNFYHGGCQMLDESPTPPYRTVRSECIPYVPLVPGTLQQSLRDTADKVFPQ